MPLVGLISDVHASPGPVAEALSIFANAGVDQVFCAGDIAGYMDELEATIALLLENNCQSVVGNHDLLYLEKHEAGTSDALAYLRRLPAFIETDIDGKKLYMVHAQPPDACHGGIKLLNKDGIVQADWLQQWRQTLQGFNYDVLVVGHTHQVFAELIGNTLVVNPGSSVFNNCCAILDIPEMTVQMFSLSGKNIEKTWNWGQHVIYGNSK